MIEGSALSACQEAHGRFDSRGSVSLHYQQLAERAKAIQSDGVRTLISVCLMGNPFWLLEELVLVVIIIITISGGRENTLIVK